MRLAVIAVLALLTTFACAKKQQDFVVAHRYTLIGKVISVNPKDQTASIDAAAVPGFMEAMTMDYPIKSKAEFDALKRGEIIKATLNVSAGNDDYNLTDVHQQSSPK